MLKMGYLESINSGFLAIPDIFQSFGLSFIIKVIIPQLAFH